MKYFIEKRRKKRSISRSSTSTSLKTSTVDAQTTTPPGQEILNNEAPSTSQSPKRMRAVAGHYDSNPASHDSETTPYNPPNTRNRKRKQSSQKLTEHADQEPKTTRAKGQATKPSRKSSTKPKNQQLQQHHTGQTQNSRKSSHSLTVQSESDGTNPSSDSSSEGPGSNTSATASLQDKSTSSPAASNQRILDRDFLDRQIKLLKTKFELDDCPGLSTAQGRRQQRKEHIPSLVMHNALRKINHKVEDDLLRGLNRQVQRKFLQELHILKRTQLSESRKERDMLGNMATDQHVRCEEATFAVSEMTKSVETMKGQLAREKDLLSRAAEIVRLGRTFSDGTFQREVQRTNSLVGQIVENFKMRGIWALSSCTTPEQKSEASRRSLRQENRDKTSEQLFSP